MLRGGVVFPSAKKRGIMVDIHRYNGQFSPKLDEFFNGQYQPTVVGENECIYYKFYDKWNEPFLNFGVRPSDVWLTCHPKTGSTWTQEMIWCVINNMDFEKAQETIHTRFPFFDMESALGDGPGIYLPDHKKVHFPIGTWKLLHSMKDPRTIKTHFHLEHLPKNIWASNAKVVYICRDPKDVCVSYYYFVVKFRNFSGDFSDFFELFTNNALMYAPIWKHILGYWEIRNRENFLFLRYEELKEDLPGIIRKVSKFLGKELHEDNIEKLVDHLSFSKMKANKAVNYEDVMPFCSKLCKQNIKFIRKGKVGEWREEFSKEQVEIFKKWTEENLKDSDFPYYREFD